MQRSFAGSELLSWERGCSRIFGTRLCHAVKLQGLPGKGTGCQAGQFWLCADAKAKRTRCAWSPGDLPSVLLSDSVVARESDIIEVCRVVLRMKHKEHASFS